jgi:hypothetical protein
MSKKLLAVASATALALSALVGVAPAMANAPAASLTGSNGNSATTGPGTSASPVLQNVPDENTLVGDDSAAIVISNLSTFDVVRITTSGKVRITTAETVGSADVNVTTLGTQSFSSTRSALGSLTVYANTTDTTTTEIKWEVVRTNLTTGGSLWIKGVAGQAYAVTNVTAPAVLANGATSEIRFAVTDVFGNQIEATPITAALTGAAANVDGVWDAALKLHKGTITSNTNNPFILTVDGNGSTANPGSVAGFAATTISVPVVINAAGASSQITNLTAQVAALTAQLAASVTKVKYNKLARKWNRANPSNRVKLAR